MQHFNFPEKNMILVKSYTDNMFVDLPKKPNYNLVKTVKILTSDFAYILCGILILQLDTIKKFWRYF